MGYCSCIYPSFVYVSLKEIGVVSLGTSTWGIKDFHDAEAPVLWPPDAKDWLIGKDPDAGKDWRQEEKGTTEDVKVGWHILTKWTWIWVHSRSWWWTPGKPGVLQSIGSAARTLVCWMVIPCIHSVWEYSGFVVDWCALKHLLLSPFSNILDWVWDVVF